MIRKWFQKIRDFLVKHRLTPLANLFLFALITYVFHDLWWDFNRHIMSVEWVQQTAEWLSLQVFHISYWINTSILGLEVDVEPPVTMWFSQGMGYIIVNNSCSGLKQAYQVTALFILFPGPWKHKSWFIPMGWVIMFLTNVFRIVVLSLVLVWRPEYWNFSHDWILRPFFYVVIFALWVWWVERFGGFFRKGIIPGKA